MNYIEMINDSLEYIEDNLTRVITLDELSERCFISKYYYLRIFKAVTNKTLREYINERRLSYAAMQVSKSSRKIIDIAFDYGYESPEVFSRSFKRFFSVTPLEYRRSASNTIHCNKLHIIERDFKNFNSDFIVDYKIQSLPAFNLVGSRSLFNPVEAGELDQLQSKVKGFVKHHIEGSNINRLYCVTDSETGLADRIGYFYGYEKHMLPKSGLEEQVIPALDYAVFRYASSMKDIHRTVFDDICKALVISDLPIDKSGPDLIEIYDENYYATNQFCVYVPICP